MSKQSNNEKKVSYHALRVELDELLDDLKDESLNVEDAIKKYERAKTIVDQLEDYLGELEQSFEEMKSSSGTKDKPSA